jgi:hypothetical protein
VSKYKEAVKEVSQDRRMPLLGEVAALGAFAQMARGLNNGDAIEALLMAGAFTAVAAGASEDEFAEKARASYRLMLVIGDATEVTGTEKPQ